MADHIGDAAELAIEEKVKQWWGDRLVPVPERALAGRGLPMRTRSFLARLGLPPYGPLLVKFHTGRDLLRPLTVAGKTYWVVGDDYASNIILKRKGDVWSVDPNGQLPSRFINASIAHFLLFLRLYVNVRQTANGDLVDTANELQAQFDANDPSALEKQENWWTVIIVQTSLGFL